MSMITHAACGKQWSGKQTAHCGGCHRTFSGLGTFMAHRVTPEGGEQGEHVCVDPATVGLVLVESRKYECWGTPSDPNAPKWWMKDTVTDGTGDESADADQARPSNST